MTIGSDGIPLCPKGFPMKQATVEPKKEELNTAVQKLLAKAALYIAHATILVLMQSMEEMFILY